MAHYDAMGKLSGLIEDAAERALRGMPPEAHQSVLTSAPSQERDTFAENVFIPSPPLIVALAARDIISFVR